VKSSKALDSRIYLIANYFGGRLLYWLAKLNTMKKSAKNVALAALSNYGKTRR